MMELSFYMAGTCFATQIVSINSLNKRTLFAKLKKYLLKSYSPIRIRKVKVLSIYNKWKHKEDQQYFLRKERMISNQFVAVNLSVTWVSQGDFLAKIRVDGRYDKT